MGDGEMAPTHTQRVRVHPRRERFHSPAIGHVHHLRARRRDEAEHVAAQARVHLHVAQVEADAGPVAIYDLHARRERVGAADVERDLAQKTVLALRGQREPVVADAASCTEGLRTMVRTAAEHGHPECQTIRVVDAVEWTATALLPRLPRPRRVVRVVLHPTCGTQLLGVTAYLEQLAACLSDEVVVPADWGCCGFAGDRGLLHPELTASATAPEVAELSQRGLLAAHPQDTLFLSDNRTCEIGMTRATGRTYRHVLEQLESATR